MQFRRPRAGAQTLKVCPDRPLRALGVQVLDLLPEAATELVDAMQSPLLWAVGEYKDGCLYVRAVVLLLLGLVDHVVLGFV